MPDAVESRVQPPSLTAGEVPSQLELQLLPVHVSTR